MNTVLRSRPVATTKTSENSYVLEVKANPWVKLLHRPSSYSSDKAILLYRISSNEWLAWIPDFGETRLNEKQFYYLN